MQVAAYQEEQHDRETALKLYRQALALARSEPALASLAQEAGQPAAAPATAAPSPQSGGRRVGWLGVGVIVGGLVMLGVVLVMLGGMWSGQTMPAASAAPIAIAIVASLGVVGLLIAGAVALNSLLLESGDRHLGWLSVGVIVGGLFTLGVMWLGQKMPAAPATPVEIFVWLGVIGLLAAGAVALIFLWPE